jgi:predicted GIY-YIG superfamily endonuclease
MKNILIISLFLTIAISCFHTNKKNENFAMKSHNIKRMMKNSKFDKNSTAINKEIIYKSFSKIANLKEYLTLNQSIEKKDTKWKYFSAIVFDSIQLSYLAFFECTDYDQDYGKLRRDNYISSYLLIKPFL